MTNHQIWPPDEVDRGKGRCVGSLLGHFSVTIGHLRITIGYLGETEGHPKVSIIHPWATLGHIKVTIDHRVTIGYLKG